MTDAHPVQPPLSTAKFGTPLMLDPGVAQEIDRVQQAVLAQPRLVSTAVRDGLMESPERVEDHIWLRVRDFVTTAVIAVAPRDWTTARNVRSAMLSLVVWAHIEHGVPLRYPALLSPVMVNRWMSGLEQATVSLELRYLYRGHVQRIASALGVALSPGDLRAVSSGHDVEPCTPADEDRFAKWMRLRRTELDRLRATALITLCLGAGLTGNEMRAARPNDVFYVGDVPWIRIDGSNPRLVPVDERWRPAFRMLHQASQDSGECLFSGKEGAPVSVAALNHWREQLKPAAPTPRKLRTTWQLNQLRARLPVHVVVERGGLRNGAGLVYLLDADPALKADDGYRVALYRQHNNLYRLDAA